MSVLGVAQLGSTLVTEISDFRGLTTCLTTYKKYRFSPFPGVAQLGSALGSGPRGRWFESSHSDHRQCRSQKSGIGTANFLVYHTMAEFRYEYPYHRQCRSQKSGIGTANFLVYHTMAEFRYKKYIRLSSESYFQSLFLCLLHCKFEG